MRWYVVGAGTTVRQADGDAGTLWPQRWQDARGGRFDVGLFESFRRKWLQERRSTLIQKLTCNLLTECYGI